MRSSRTSQTPRRRDRGPGIAWATAVVFVSLLLAGEVARLEIASHVAETNPRLATRLAPHSPDAMVSLAMANVGRAAARGGDPDKATMDRLQQIGTAAPLQPEPFLVEAALAERKNDFASAERLLRQARWRNPRSTAARYLLADVWLRENKVVEGLGEMATLTRLLPSASVQLVPALAEYAHSPGARTKLFSILQSNPQLKRPLLNALAADPDNADLVVALAGADIRSADDSAKSWKARLLAGFVKKGDFDGAYRLWRGFAGLGPNASSLLFNGDFGSSPAPAPFNWTYLSSGAGVAEPGGGKVRVLYYGRDDAILVSQLLLLKPGTYSFHAPVGGTAAANALVWTLSCVTTGQKIMSLAVSGSTPAASFSVPANCGAQILALEGHSSDMPQDSDIQIGPAGIERTGV